MGQLFTPHGDELNELKPQNTAAAQQSITR
jgi:hypothetical protein